MKKILFSQTAKQFHKFIFIGVISTIINYLMFFLLFKQFQIHYLGSSIFGYLSGFLFGYVYNSSWTFLSSDASKKIEFLKYLSVYLFSLIFGTIVLKILVEYSFVNPLLANVFVIFLSTVMNFTGCKLCVFKVK